uniref:Uncharacterized protein n=1 Tax=Siphoviridae sp. ctjZA23 TaxID=2825633 RepID=A0A8S5PD15_9CAUD|nr:MAG TPA: hypothetical protein [Siphoviridae sp. ctjZA23]
MNDKFRRSLERVVFKNKKTLLDYHRNIDRTAFDGLKFGFKIADERMLKDGRLERTFQD